jgi:phosphatidylserine decarboxylase
VADPHLARRYVDGAFVTLRLTSSMYHRFHAPYDCTVERVVHIAGDTWNVNPIALKRVRKLFCRNERAVVECALAGADAVVTLVPVAAILVAGIRLHCLDAPLVRSHRGKAPIPCRAAYAKGAEMGWFEHGSTIIVLAPKGFALCEGVREGATIRMGQKLMSLPRCAS